MAPYAGNRWHPWFPTLALAMALTTGLAAELPPAHRAGSSGSLDEFDNLVLHQSQTTGRTRLFLGDVHGFLHVYEKRGDVFQEVWLSDYFEGPIGGLEFLDANGDGSDEILLYTTTGRIYYLDTEDYTILWSNPVDEYETISSLVVHDVDDDISPELVMIADGRLVYYDGRRHFEEWRSDEKGMVATDIVIGDVDGDEDEEIVLNDGNVYRARVPKVEWQYNQSFGEKMGLLDIDGDGTLEVIGEYDGRYLRVFDIDLRRMQNINR